MSAALERCIPVELPETEALALWNADTEPAKARRELFKAKAETDRHWVWNTRYTLKKRGYPAGFIDAVLPRQRTGKKMDDVSKLFRELGLSR